MSNSPIIYLTDEDVSGLVLEAEEIRQAIGAAFRLYSRGEVRCEPKTSIAIGPGHAFQSLSAVNMRANFAALKWVGMVPPGGDAKVNINASILLSDTQTGQIVCIMDARRATALRTAGMSAVAAQHLARKDSVTAGFVGAGVQAKSHLEALVELLPSLSSVLVNSTPPETANRFADMARGIGLEAAVLSAQDVVSRSDIVVTTVPLAPGFQPFIDPSWVRQGAFALAVDLGRSWKHDGFSDFDITAVDEEAMKHYAKPGNLVPPLQHAQATLADLADGRHPGRSSPAERIMLVSSGSAVADLAISMLIYRKALAKGAGASLGR